MPARAALVVGVARARGLAVVFGSVVEGEAVVRAVERVGSDSGKTSATVVIAASGELKQKAPDSASGGGSGGGSSSTGSGARATGDGAPHKKQKKKSSEGGEKRPKEVDF